MRRLRLAALGVLLPLAGWAQTPPAPAGATPLRPPTQQYPSPGIQSQPLPPPPGVASPSLTGAPPADPAPPGTVPPAAAPQSPGPAAPAPAAPGPAAPITSPAAPGQPPPEAAPQPPAPNPWLPQGSVELQVLDKPDAQSAMLTVKVGQSATYRSLTIAVEACVIRPPDMPPDAAAFLAITDNHPDQPGFRGWMVRSDPSLNMLQNPIYDVRVKGCVP